MKRPILSTIGVLIPFATAAGMFLWLRLTTHGQERMGILATMVIFIPAACGIGALVSIISLIRGEAWPWLGVFGLLGSIAGTAWFLQWLFPRAWGM